jgi:hypothetical protein
LQEFFDIEDARIATLHPRAYMAPGETITAAQMEDRSRQYGDIVLGYLDEDLNGTLVVNKSKKIKYEDVHKMIVMTTDPAVR